MTKPTSDPLPPHLRRAVNILGELHEAVDRREKIVGNRANYLHDQLDAAETAIVAEAQLPPRPAEPDPAYASLHRVLARAYNQAATGKGAERHVRSDKQRFDDQPICTLQRIYGTGYAFGQASKKAEESTRLPRDRAVAELLGAINYLAAAVIVLEEGDGEGTEKA